MLKTTTLFAFALSLAALSIGCQGGRINLIDQVTAEGIWYDSTLIRRYEGVTLVQAVAAIDAYLEAQGLRPSGREINPHDAEIVTHDTAGLRYQFDVWVPADKPYLELGVEIGSGDVIRSAELLTTLEKSLPGKRVDQITK